MNEGQEQARNQLEAIAAEGDAVELLRVEEPVDPFRDFEVELTLRCSGYEQRASGVKLRPRERFRVAIPPEFPFKPPSVSVSHKDWAGSPHVQWASHLCLYQAPATEWDPADGMYGFIDRLRYWLERAALGELDAAGAPLHPPAAYARDYSLPQLIPRVDTPVVADRAWVGLAELRQVSERRVDIVGWTDPMSEPWPAFAGVAILLPEPLTWEYPTKVDDLLVEFERQGVDRGRLLALLRIGAVNGIEEQPLYVVVGSPMRGVAGGERRQHLEVWYLRPVIVGGLRLSVRKFSDHDQLREIGEEVEQIILDWAGTARIEFCPVREDRPEVTARRDEGSPLVAFRGKTVAIWGCGALGGWVADALTRAGVARLILYDNAAVSLGLLVRQPFDDGDVGYGKAPQLRQRLVRIRPDLDVDARGKDVLATALEADDWSDGADIVIDATAAVSVATKLERARCLRPRDVTVMSMLLGHRAERGLLALARPEAAGAPADVVRRAKLGCAARPELATFLDEFWPDPPRKDVFQPEPGCSDATFRGSAAEVIALAMALLTAAAQELSSGLDAAVAHLVALPAVEHEGRRHARLAWPADVVVTDGLSSYEIRLAEPALDEIRAWTRRSARVLGPRVETGGLLFGQRDDAAGVIWVSEVTGPPPDSIQSDEEFVCGVAGNDRYRDEKHTRGRGSLGFVGMWHTHPSGDAMCSARDIISMATLVLQDETPLPKSLALILGATPDEPELGAYVFERAQFAKEVNTLHFRDERVRPGLPRPRDRNVGLALSGGGARAVAFHLGCLRALHDRGVLDRLQVVSGVSGGAVMTAAWAYSDDEFLAFDARIVALLKRGLTGGIVRRTLLGRAGLAALAANATSGVAAVAARTASAVMAVAAHLPGMSRRRLTRLQPPLRRFASRTDALAQTLAADLLGDVPITAPRRGDVAVVVNACELRTGSSFRFGSRESGSWRHGTVDGNDVALAEAVAASAAYPVFLPALDKKWRFVRRSGQVVEERVVLTDGGVYDNLGTSCLEPGRSADITYNIYPVDYIISCDAGRGLLAADPIPYFWISRMKRSFEAIFRKAQDGGRARLHQYAADDHLKGFVMPYLGNQDSALPVAPVDLVPREQVVDYPTDFSAMSDTDIELIARRGEQLARLLVDYYCPEL